MVSASVCSHTKFWSTNCTTELVTVWGKTTPLFYPCVRQSLSIVCPRRGSVGGGCVDFLVRHLLVKGISAEKAQLWMAISLHPWQLGIGCLRVCKGSNSMATTASTKLPRLKISLVSQSTVTQKSNSMKLKPCSGVPEPASISPQELIIHVFPARHSVMSCWELETVHGGSTYTMETGKSYAPGPFYGGWGKGGGWSSC